MSVLGKSLTIVHQGKMARKRKAKQQLIELKNYHFILLFVILGQKED